MQNRPCPTFLAPRACRISATTQDAMLTGERHDEPRAAVALDQPRVARPARRLPPCRGRISRRSRPAQRGRGVHPPDHRLARIYARHLLAGGSRLWTSATSWRRRARCPASTGPGETDMPCLADAIGQTARQCLRAPHPAADGAPAISRCWSASIPPRSATGIWSSMPTPMNGSRCPTRIGMSQFADGGRWARNPMRRAARTSIG